jgi:hypothetical protein
MTAQMRRIGLFLAWGCKIGNEERGGMHAIINARSQDHALAIVGGWLTAARRLSASGVLS